MKIRNNFLFVLVLVSCSLFLVTFPALAAEVFFSPFSQAVGVGNTFEVGVYINTDNKLINSVEGRVVFPAETLAVRDIRDGDSLVSLWIKRPSVPATAKSGEIPFAGLLPGGYAGSDGFLFSIVFEAKVAGQVTLRAGDVRILLNDGKGTEASVRQTPLSFNVSGVSVGENFIAPADTDPPAEFTPYVAQDQNLYEGKWFLVFATQDKGSGIDHYELQETRDKRQVARGDWVVAQSLYPLQDQELKSWIFVKAVDKAGNERLAVLEPTHRPLPLRWFLTALGLLGLVLFIILLARFLGSRRNPSWRQGRAGDK